MKKIAILFLVFVCANLLAQTVTTLAGSGSHDFANGTGTAASFKYPDGLAVDESGNVYVADVENHLIRKITSAGVVTTFAGSGSKGSEDGTGTAASFNYPVGVAVDSSGNIYVGGNLNHLIRKITSAGVVKTFAGSGSAGSEDGTGTAASFNKPRGVALDGWNMYIADWENHLIRKITSAGVVTTFAGSGSKGSEDGTGTAASFNRPLGVAVDGSGNVYVADYGSHLIRKITSAGVVTTLAGSGSHGNANGTGTAASFNRPRGVAVDGSGNVYVADYINNLIRKITSAGVVTTLAGSGSAGNEDGTGTAASFSKPRGIAVDGSGNVYVAGSGLIRKISIHATLKVPSQYSTIQAGIDAASDGDTVLVADGTYTENLSINKDIVIISENGAEQTIIDGNNDGRVVSINSSAYFEGFTLINGKEDSGAGMLISTYNPKIVNVIIKDNVAGRFGGGIATNNYATPIFYNIMIANNSAGDFGGGILVDGGSTPILINVTITKNSDNGKGGGIYNVWKARPLLLMNSIISNNVGSQIYWHKIVGDVSNPPVMNISHSDIFGKITMNNSGKMEWLTENKDIDPLFLDKENDNFMLSDSSPIIGEGVLSVTIDGNIYNSLSNDVIGNPRPNPAGSNPDMGAFENKWGTPQNAPPVITAMNDVTVNEDESYSDTLRAADEEGDAITYSVSSDTSAVTTSISDSILTLTPKENWHGVANIKAYASDGYSKDSTSFKLTVTAVNDAPVISGIPDDSTNEETTKYIVFTASDLEQDGINFSVSSDTSGVSVSIIYDAVSSLVDTLKLVPVKDYVGIATITLIGADENSGGSLSDTISFKFKVININDSPVISSISDITINEDETGTATLSATDIDGDAITYSAVSDTNVVTVSVSSATLTLAPTANWNGAANIKAYASDGYSKDSTSFKLTVTAVQDSPIAFEWASSALDTVNITFSKLADTYDLQWSASTDVDGDTIDYLLYAQIGVHPPEEIYDTTSTSVSITYEELRDNITKVTTGYTAATLKYSVVATDGIDTVNVTGDDRVVFVDLYGLSTVSEGIPTVFALHENYPNPFNPTTTLRFDLPDISDVTLTIYNMLGQRVRTFNMNDTPAGYHSVRWNATNDYGDPVGAGVYLYQLRANQFVKTRKMVLLK